MKLFAGFAAAAIVLSPTCLRAAPAKSTLEIVVLGSGGPRAFGRAGSSFLVLVEGTPRILVDAGPGAFLRIGEMDMDLERVDTVLLTQLHIDQSADLSAFFNARALTSHGPIFYRIFGPDGAALSEALAIRRPARGTRGRVRLPEDVRSARDLRRS